MFIKTCFNRIGRKIKEPKDSNRLKGKLVIFVLNAFVKFKNGHQYRFKE